MNCRLLAVSNIDLEISLWGLNGICLHENTRTYENYHSNEN